MPREPRLYPVFLKLAGMRAIVVGGGAVAASKLEGLIEAGAHVTVIAPHIGDAIRERALRLARDEFRSALPRASITLVPRAFEPTDLDGARWVVAAAPPAVNRAVAAAAETWGVFVNAVDDKASATAYLGGVVRRGALELAISTGGLAPALAGLVREAIDAILPDALDLDRWMALAATARTDWKRAGVPIHERRPLLLRALDRLYTRAEAA